MGIRIAANHGHGKGPTIAVCCPACGRDGTFDRIEGVEDLSIPPRMWLGQRKCPNSKCLSHLFFIYDKDAIITFPPQKIDFDTQNIPQKIISVFEEAIACHANRCFVAAAIMIRRTLEEICHDRGATGDNLEKRVKSLRDKIVIPNELFDGVDDLRLLGNDAAHIESKSFDKIDQEEVEICIEFTKEILKAVYQYSHLVSRIKNLKKKATLQ